jgi:DNA sulfur modification protein DndC
MLTLKKQDIKVIVENVNRVKHHVRMIELSSLSKMALNKVLDDGFNHWILTFSGGKDSTSTAIITLEAALEMKKKVKRIDLIYADTTVEIPSIHQYALDFISNLKKNPRMKSLNLNCHIVLPPIEERFWVKILGKGYPPPHQKFRWCTRRLKIEPAEKHLRQYIKPNKTVIITGVRFGESKERDRRLNLSCARGGECGQGLWYQHSNRLKAAYLAPLIDWSNCDVWDFISFIAPSIGYPTEELFEIYNGNDTRFGCWTCTVVKQDKAMERTIKQEKWSHLKPIAEFRNYMWDYTRTAKTRVIRDNGQPGKLKLRTRKTLFNRLLKIQQLTKLKIIDSKEISFIKRLWEDEFSK